MFGLNLGATSSSGATGAYNFGNYIQTDGVNDEGLMASRHTISGSDFVLSFWMKQASGGNTTNIVCQSQLNAGYIYVRHGSNPNIRLQMSGLSNTRQDWNSITWNDDLWHHVYFYSDGTDVKLAFDGIDKGDGGSGQAYSSFEIYSFFYRTSGSPFYAQLGLDDFIFTQTTGSLTQAQSLYNSGAGENPVTVIGSTPDIWYKFNVTDGTTTIPNSGSAGSNDLTLSNFVTPYIFPR